MADTTVSDNRFAPITPDNESGSIWIATLLCLVYSFITLSTRAWLRQKMYGFDDYLILLAFLFQLGSAVATILALNHGLGQTLALLRDSAVHSASSDSFAALILFLLSALVAKCSTLCLMMRLFNLSGRKSQTNHHGSSRLYLRTCYAILGLMVLGGIAALVTASVDCHPSTFILAPSEAQCSSQPLRWRIITGLDVATEALLILTNIVIVYPVHLAWHLKCQVILAFAFRLPLIALAVLRMYYVDRYANAENPGLAQTPIAILQQVYMAWSIISATIPNIKSFVRSFGSGFGIGIDMETYTAAYGSKNSRQKSYEMASVGGTNHRGMNGSAHASKNRSQIDDDEVDEIVTPIRSVRTGEATLHDPSIPRSRHANKVSYGGAADEVSIESVRSDKHIIRKDVQWSVGYEARAI